MTTFDNHMIRLLLVDDEDEFRSVVARRLGKRGFSPIQASNGKQCLQMLSKTPADVVVLDVKMPGMSGIDTLKTIKQRYKRTQVILLTGNVAVLDGIEGIKAGAFDYLTKPVEIDHLANKIRQAFEINRLEQEKDEEIEYRTKLEKKMIDSERLVSLGMMATGIAHEINNPLAIINESAGFMREIINASEMSDHAKKASLELGLEKIDKSIKRARKITHQLLGYVKKEDIRFSQVNLKTLMNETLGLLKTELKNKNISVNWDMDRGRNVIWTDPYRIRQVLMNLLNNAIYALKTNGAITLSSNETHTDIFFAIQDNGIGIAKENLGKIFDPFFTTKSFDEGTGLGLFVVHKILSNIDGEIKVKSDLSKGTSFIVKLPKRPENEK